MMNFKYTGLVADLMPNIRIMQASGLFLLEYHEETSGFLPMLRTAYASITLVLVVVQWFCLVVNLMLQKENVADLTANTITVLFFLHCLTKNVHFATRRRHFYRTLSIWNQSNSHPLFAESNNRYHSIALKKQRLLLYIISSVTAFACTSWTTITFFGDSVHYIKDPMNPNETIVEELPRLLVRSWYPWDAMSGTAHILTLVFQVWYVTASLLHANYTDSMFCSWLIFACEQLVHLKEILKSLMELSACLDTYVPKSGDLFRAPSATKGDNEIEYENRKNQEITSQGIYSTSHQEMGGKYSSGVLQTFGGGGGGGAGFGPNSLTQKQEYMVRSAIKYWVERHKHVVRLTYAIGDAYGVALLFHMLTSTVMLTLLAYQATKIEGINVYAFSTMGYLVFALAQVFHFCIYGNRLIEESASIMEAAYSCQWYDGSDEAKTFVQIVCQQCQKSLMISGAKFFTISLDLFASVLGATVTYFMVLVQLN